MRTRFFNRALILAGFIVGLGLLGLARAQSTTSGNFLDAGGQPMGNDVPTVQVKVTARVVDSEAGKPLPAFYLTTGELDRDRTSFDWAEKTRQLITRDAFTISLTKAKLPPALLIEADGYLPQCSGSIRSLETNLTFLLKKGNGPSGILLTPGGQPAAGRTVYLSRQRDRDLVLLEGPKLTPKVASPRVRSTVTDAAGRFSFTPEIDAFGVVVADEAGFAQERVEQLALSPELRLQPWARVEGTLNIGAQPGSNETVRLADAFNSYAYYPRRLPPYSIVVETTTDGTGRFVFPRVPPVDLKVFHAPKVGPADGHVIPITQITNLTLRGGETRIVQLGGQGRPVTGRVVLKNYGKPIDWLDHVFWIDSIAPEPRDCPSFEAINQEYYHARDAARTHEDLEAAEVRYLAEKDRLERQLCAYYSSPAGRQYWFSKRSYVLRFTPDGSFRIDDVPGGKYELTIDLREQIVVKGQPHSPLIDLHRQEIEVPDAAGGRSDTPLDLGVVRMVAPLRQGSKAPDFSVKTVDGKSVALADLKGKYVLVDFWATWNAHSLGDLPDLLETYAAFKNNPQFAMLGMNLDTNLSSARAYAIKHHAEWPQGFLGPWSESDLPDQFGVEDLPSVMLLDPNGRVLLTGLHGGGIKSAVESALKP